MTGETTTLPDDPRDCCEAILNELRKVDEWPVTNLPKDFASLIIAVCEGESDHLVEARAGINILASQARDAAELYHRIVSDARELARHGTCRHREADKRMAEGKPAYGGPTWGEVKAAQRALASVGKAVSDADAVALLEDEDATDAA